MPRYMSDKKRQGVMLISQTLLTTDTDKHYSKLFSISVTMEQQHQSNPTPSRLIKQKHYFGNHTAMSQ